MTMLAPIFQDPTFNLDWMERNRKLRNAAAQETASFSVPSSSSQESETPQTETPNAVAAGSESAQAKSSTEKSASPDDSKKESKQNERRGKLTPDDKREVSQLQTIDRQVRAHEQAHLSAAQGIAVSGASFGYQVGPDAKRYAVAGEVSIDTSREREPAQTIAKGYNIIRAALAPADPSAQDRAVAANAQQMIQQAQAELMRESYAQNQAKEETETETEDVGQQIDQQV